MNECQMKYIASGTQTETWIKGAGHLRREGSVGIGTSLEGPGEMTRNTNSRERVGYVGGGGQTKEAGISIACGQLESVRKPGGVEDGNQADESLVCQTKKPEREPGQGGAIKGFQEGA